MQLLFIHADFIEYEAKEKTRVAEPLEPGQKNARLDEALVAFIAVEQGDEANVPSIVAQAANETLAIADQVNAERIVLYPYAHLSAELASPETSIELLRRLEADLSARDVAVTRAPFGWYKSFTLRCKGHPLSELSRKITVAEGLESETAPEERKSKALVAEEKAISQFFIADGRGNLVGTDAFVFEPQHDNLRKFYLYESEKRREVDKIPPHVELMKRLELADYEPSSDPGNLRFYPKGKLIKSLIEDYVRNSVAEYGAVEVETPIMYSALHPSLKDYLERFPARQYSLLGKGGKPDLFLRFAACFGQFLMSSESSISYKHLPLKIFELAPSFRKEKRGELVGLRRLRKFTMPDMHTLCREMDEALEEFRKQYEFCMHTLAAIGFSPADYEIALRYTREFYEDEHSRALLDGLIQKAGRPVLIERWDQRFFYFVLKFEFNFVDALGKASALSTVQIDVENAERYGITFTDADGTLKSPIILHCSPSGAIERCMYALLEKAYLEMEAGALPVLPLWLAPTQLRFIPVAERHVAYIEDLLPHFKGIRVDLDDRDETVSKKIREAGRDWIPYVAVIGDQEVERQILAVTIRADSTKQQQKKAELTVSQLRARLDAELVDKPFRPLPLAVKLSQRAKFAG
ncbi:MAG TPA: threonine--tRNA ligase [Methanomicrobia archaeon]|nr:threonine--tRNA ligase [Methanomicrobia archaeon]